MADHVQDVCQFGLALVGSFVEENKVLIILLTALLMLGLRQYYRNFVVKRPRLFVKSGSRLEELLRLEMPILGEPFRPIPWCLEPRLQSHLGHRVRATLPKTKCQREVLTMADGINIGLDWLDRGTNNNNKTECQAISASATSLSLIVLIFPGLAGTSQSDYIRSLSSTIEAHHCHSSVKVVMVCYQGVNRVPVGAPRLVSSVAYEEAAFVVDHVSKRNPMSPILAVGASAGGHILGSYLVKRGREARQKLTAALFICNLWDYSKAMTNMERGLLNHHINGQVADQQVKRVSRYRDVFMAEESLDVNKAMKSRTMREFDSNLMAPTNGFGNVDEYYSHVPLHELIHQISVPSLAIAAADDHFQPEWMLPLKSFSNSDKVALMMTKYGGHLAFMEGWVPKQHNYLERAFSQFVSTVERNAKLLKSL